MTAWKRKKKEEKRDIKALAMMRFCNSFFNAIAVKHQKLQKKNDESANLFYEALRRPTGSSCGIKESVER